MDLGLDGKVALVTGGANGVGRAICLALAGEGAAVAVNYRSSAEQAHAVAAEIASKGGKAISVGADVGDLAAVKAMVEKVAGEFGGLDILVNNAGVAQRQRFTETTPEDWRRQIDTCLYGAIHCCHAAAPYLEKKRQRTYRQPHRRFVAGRRVGVVDRRRGAGRGDRPRQVAGPRNGPLRRDRQYHLAGPHRDGT